MNLDLEFQLNQGSPKFKHMKKSKSKFLPKINDSMTITEGRRQSKWYKVGKTWVDATGYSTNQ